MTRPRPLAQTRRPRQDSHENNSSDGRGRRQANPARQSSRARRPAARHGVATGPVTARQRRQGQELERPDHRGVENHGRKPSAGRRHRGLSRCARGAQRKLLPCCDDVERSSTCIEDGREPFGSAIRQAGEPPDDQPQVPRQEVTEQHVKQQLFVDPLRAAGRLTQFGNGGAVQHASVVVPDAIQLRVNLVLVHRCLQGRHHQHSTLSPR